MKDIKELIYAAVEENALKFQEIVNNQLQVRAYEAIESLRPEIGASMFGESSHKKMDDEDEEDMEDEEDEDEEELKGKQHKIDKNKNGKIDAHDFKLLRKEEVAPSTSRFHVLVHKSSSTNVEKAHHAVSGAGNKNFRPGTGLARMDKPGGSHDPTGGDHHVIHAPDHATHENLRKNLSDYGARATIVDTHTGKREDVHEEAQRLKEMSDAERRTELKRVGNKAAQTQGYDHPGDEAVNKASSSAVKSELKAVRKFVAGTAKPYRSPANEEVEQINELKPETYRKLAVARDARARHFSGIAQHPYNRGSSDETHFNKLADRDRAVAKKAADKAGVSHSDISHGNYDHVTNKVKEEVEQKNIFRNPKLSAKDQLKNPPKQIKVKEDVNEVAMPKNAADWQALITHQIQTTDHPVATDAQFRAQNCKDMSKVASLEPGKDALQYATAQGGTVKRP